MSKRQLQQAPETVFLGSNSTRTISFQKHVLILPDSNHSLSTETLTPQKVLSAYPKNALTKVTLRRKTAAKLHNANITYDCTSRCMHCCLQITVPAYDSFADAAMCHEDTSDLIVYSTSFAFGSHLTNKLPMALGRTSCEMPPRPMYWEC